MKKNPVSILILAIICLSILVGCSVVASNGRSNLPDPPQSIIGENNTPVTLDATLSKPSKTAEPSSDPVTTFTEPAEPALTDNPEISLGPVSAQKQFDLTEVPGFFGKAYVAVNGNTPYFTATDLTTTSFENYSTLDSLGRCGGTYACVGKDLMPTGERGNIEMVKPAGWHTIRYDDLVDGKYLYNRCHLIGFQLSGENANEKNLITGTRYLNIQGMLLFENMVADYVKETNNHVMYRVTPYYDGNNLLATGILMEGYSVEDDGAGICFCVFAYNAQPYVDIDYTTGDSARAADAPSEPTLPSVPTKSPQPKSNTSEKPGNIVPDSPTYIGNTNTKKFHYPNCSSVDQMNDSNKAYFYEDREEPINMGFSPCGRCHP